MADPWGRVERRGEEKRGEERRGEERRVEGVSDGSEDRGEISTPYLSARSMLESGSHRSVSLARMWGAAIFMDRRGKGERHRESSLSLATEPEGRRRK